MEPLYIFFFMYQQGVSLSNLELSGNFTRTKIKEFFKLSFFFVVSFFCSEGTSETTVSVPLIIINLRLLTWLSQYMYPTVNIKEKGTAKQQKDSKKMVFATLRRKFEKKVPCAAIVSFLFMKDNQITNLFRNIKCLKNSKQMLVTFVNSDDVLFSFIF